MKIFIIFLTNQNGIYNKQRWIIPYKAWKGETPTTIYKVKVLETKHQPNEQNKLYNNAHTRDQMLPPVMVTITKGSMPWF